MTDLIPPDPKQCQVMIRPAHGPFVLGPKPKYARCTNKPEWLAVEVVPDDKDGQCGSMSVCNSCAQVMMKDPTLRARVELRKLPGE